MERKAWLRGLWEIVREVFCQRFETNHLRSSPLLLPSNTSGLSIIVTGATSGIGLHTARELAMAGAHVILACRNTKAANEIASGWREEAHNSRMPNVEVMELDLLSLSSVRQFAADWEQRALPLNVLINNAGILRMREPQRFSDDGLEHHVQVNHVAPALLTLLLLPSLLRAPSSRIINVNSVAHHCAVVEPNYWNSRIEDQKFSTLKVYGASKLAHLMFLKTLARKLLDHRKDSIQCVAVHPGIVTTNLVRNYILLKTLWMFDAAEGARSVLFCATSADITDNPVKGFAYYSCNCKPGRLAPQALDMDACEEIWQKTLEVLHLSPDFLSRVAVDTKH